MRYGDASLRYVPRNKSPLKGVLFSAFSSFSFVSGLIRLFVIEGFIVTHGNREMSYLGVNFLCSSFPSYIIE